MPGNVAINWSWGFISGNNFLFISVGAWVKQPKGVLEGLDDITFISLYLCSMPSTGFYVIEK